MTAKFWGTGPQEWTAGMASRFTLGAATNGTPQNSRSPPARISGQSSSGSSLAEAPRPTQLCHWAIRHRDTVHYESLPAPQRVEQASFDSGDQSSWTACLRDPSLTKTPFMKPLSTTDSVQLLPRRFRSPVRSFQRSFRYPTCRWH